MHFFMFMFLVPQTKPKVGGNSSETHTNIIEENYDELEFESDHYRPHVNTHKGIVSFSLFRSKTLNTIAINIQVVLLCL